VITPLLGKWDCHELNATFAHALQLNFTKGKALLCQEPTFCNILKLYVHNTACNNSPRWQECMRTVDGQIFHSSEFGKTRTEVGDVFQTVNGLCFPGGLGIPPPVTHHWLTSTPLKAVFEQVKVRLVELFSHVLFGFSPLGNHPPIGHKASHWLMLREIDFLQKLTGGFKLFACAETSHLNIDTYKFKSSQTDKSRSQSADSSKAYSNLGAFKWMTDIIFWNCVGSQHRLKACDRINVCHKMQNLRFSRT